MRILAVYAHPDDESFGPAAFLAREAHAGADVFGLFATRGERGGTHLDPPPTPAALAELRERDLREAAALIGFADLEILGYPDGGLNDLPGGELEARVRKAIARRRANVVLTFGPAGIASPGMIPRSWAAAISASKSASVPKRGSTAQWSVWS